MARKLIVEIVGDSRSYERSLGRSQKATSTFGKTIEQSFRGSAVATVGFRGLGRSIAFASGAFLGGAGLTKAITSSVSEASDLNEEINKSRVVFGKSSSEILAWSKTTATAFGIARSTALGAAGGFGAMLETAGLSETQAAGFSRKLVELGADMASFNNISVDDALQKLKSGLAGEAEPLRTVGVLLSESRVKTEAYRLGLAKTGATLTEAQKVQARYSLILKDTARQQGDFGRTSSGLANQQRILSAQVKDLQAKLGTALLPTVLDIVGALNRWIGNTENQRKAQKLLTEGVKNGREAFRQFRDTIVPLAGTLRDVVRQVGGFRRAIELLLVVMVVSKVVNFAGAITGLGTAAEGATGRVNGLRVAMGRLAAIGVITIGVELVLHKDDIERTSEGWLRKHHLGFLTSTTIDIPVHANVDQLKKIRAEIAGLKGDGDLAVKALDATIARLEKIARLRNARRDRSQEGAGAGFLIPSFIQPTTPPPGETAAQRTKRLAREAAARAKALKKAADLAQTAFDNLISSLQLKFDIAAAKRGFKNDLAVLNEIKQAILARIKVVGETTDLARQLFDNTQQMNEVRREAAKAAQFKALGLTPEGDKPTPSSSALLKRARGLQHSLKGTVLDTSKTRSELRRIVTFLKQHLHNAGREVRQAILQMLNDINGAGSGTSATGPLTKTTSLNSRKIVEGLGLSGSEIRALRSRLSNFNSAGRGLAAAGSRSTPGNFLDDRPFVVNVNVNLDGKKIATSTTRHQQKDRRRNPKQKRGPRGD